MNTSNPESSDSLRLEQERLAERPVTHEQYQELYEELLLWAEKNLTPTEYVDYKPVEDPSAEMYELPCLTWQARQVFHVPAVIRRMNPRDFKVSLITPHRFEVEEERTPTIYVSYSYGETESAGYFMSQHEQDGNQVWSGNYTQDELDIADGPAEEDVPEDQHDMVMRDFNIVRSIIEYARSCNNR